MSKGKSQGKRQMCAVCIPEGSAGPASRSEIARSHPCAPTFCANSFRFTHFRENASANPLESHTFKTKDLKPFRFTHFQKKVGWTPRFPPDAHLQSPVYPEAGRVTNHKSLRLSPLISALTSKRPSKSFTSNTYEKHAQGEGCYRVSNFEFRRRSRAGDAFSIRGILLYSTGTIHPRFFYKFGGERAQCLQTASRSSSRDRN